MHKVTIIIADEYEDRLMEYLEEISTTQIGEDEPDIPLEMFKSEEMVG